jgi:hypothetical protein
MKWLNIVSLVIIGNALNAQLPETDLWLFKIKTEKDQFKLGEGKNITSRKGYDNQPFFSPDTKTILYVSIRGDNQADVYSYDISKDVSTQLTKTKVSEYSPNYTPDQKAISCVVVEPDSAQRLWLYHLDGSVKKCYNVGIDSIGYYSWFSNDTLMYYKLTDPHSLRIQNNALGEDKWICDRPARAFKRISGDRFIYAIKDSALLQYRIYNTLLKKSELFAIHQSSSEDFNWHATLGLIKSEGAMILRYDEKTKSWTVLFDLSNTGIKKITRFSIDPKVKYLVVVDNT